MPSPFHPSGNSSDLRKGRISESWACYAVTKVFWHRERHGLSATAAETVQQSMQHLRHTDRVKLFAHCLMPDHLHLAFCLMPGETLSGVVGSFSKYTAARINQQLNRNGRLWQEGFHNRRCRNRDELALICEYIEHNPVRAGLVTSAEEWANSSAHPSQRDHLDREWWP